MASDDDLVRHLRRGGLMGLAGLRGVGHATRDDEQGVVVAAAGGLHVGRGRVGARCPRTAIGTYPTVRPCAACTVDA